MKFLYFLMVVLGALVPFRHALHMFQQNGYINKEELVWLCKHNDRQRDLLFNLIFGALALIDFWLFRVLFVLVLVLALNFLFLYL